MKTLTMSWACAALLLTGAADARSAAIRAESFREPEQSRTDTPLQSRGRWCEPTGSGYYECFDEYCYDDYSAQKSVCTLTAWTKEMDE